MKKPEAADFLVEALVEAGGPPGGAYPAAVGPRDICPRPSAKRGFRLCFLRCWMGERITRIELQAFRAVPGTFVRWSFPTGAVAWY